MKSKIEKLEEEAESLERHIDSLRREVDRQKTLLSDYHGAQQSAYNSEQQALKEKERVLKGIEIEVLAAEERLKTIDLALNRKKNIIFFGIPGALVIVYCYLCFMDEDPISTFNILMGLLSYYAFLFAPKLLDKAMETLE